MKKTIKENYPLFVFGVTITAFVLIFTRFFMKMDDGNFLGIALAPDFTYEGFLTERYNNISGRTINEFLVMFFCRHNIIWWKLFISTLLIFIVCFFSYISVAEIGFLKGDIRLRDFLKVEQFNQKYPAILLAKLTAISLVQFILAFILVIALMKTCQEWSILAVSSIGSYFISLFIFRLEDLKIYYMNNADIAQLVE